MRVLFAIVVAVSTPGLSAQESSRQLSGGQTNFYEDRVQTQLAPSSSLVDIVSAELRDLRPRVGIEISLRIPVSDEAFTNAGRIEIYNILRSISTMEGIEYYSASRDEMRTFYHVSHAIAGPDDRSPVEDPLVNRIPAEDTIYAFQEDGSFGRNVQELTYRAISGQFLVSMENRTTMVYRVVPLVSSGNLRTFLLVQPVPEDGVLVFYGNLGVRVPALFGMQDRARDSFYNRIVALHDWFSARLTEAGLAD